MHTGSQDEDTGAGMLCKDQTGRDCSELASDFLNSFIEV